MLFAFRQALAVAELALFVYKNCVEDRRNADA